MFTITDKLFIQKWLWSTSFPLYTRFVRQGVHAADML